MTQATPQRTDARGAALRERFGFLRDLVAEMERSVPYAAALASSADGVRLALRDGEQQAARREPAHGVVLTAIEGGVVEEEALSDTDPAAVQAAARQLVERVKSRAAGRTGRAGQHDVRVDPGAPLDAGYATPAQIDANSVTLADKLERFEALRRRARALDPRVVQAMARYMESTESKLFVNRTRFITQVLRRVHLNLSIFVSDGQGRRYDWHIRGGSGGLELLDISDDDLAGLRDDAVALLSALPVAPGVYDVVTDPGISGVLAHEAFGHGVETDMFLKQRARGAAYIGRRVGSPLVTMYDDPTVPGGYGSYFFDDEGNPASPTCIIKDGILQRGLSDLYSATRLGISRSANGRRESFANKAYARMSNTFFAAGTHTREQVLGSLENGLLLCQASSGMEDPKGWGIQVSAHYAREYRAGKPTGVVYSPISITGYVPDLLNAVSMVAGDLHLHPGTCGKGWKEYVPVADGGPHLRTRARLG